MASTTTTSEISRPVYTDRIAPAADRAALEAAIAEFPGFYLYHERLGDLLASEGENEAARAAYERALELRPSAAWIRAKRDRLDASPRPSEDPEAETPAFYLFMPFYTPRDPERAAELLYCLDHNLSCGIFARITLLIDDDTPMPRNDPRLAAIRLDHRPTYLDWVRESRRSCPGRISILANSDIHFDDTIGRLGAIFANDPMAFVALSRFDKTGDTLTPHSNPHWSQDTWAFRATGPDLALDARLAVPLGVPRCDGKIAYLFSILGYRVYNPVHFIRSVHVHETNLRYYNRTEDRTVLGGVANVHPSAALTEPARIDVDVWAQSTAQYASVKFNRTLERWDEERRQAALPRPRIIAHDADWQYPAITEKHAFDMMRRLLPPAARNPDTVYLGFPFATLIDLHTHVGPTEPRTQALKGVLDSLMPDLKRYRRVITVAQHIRARQFAEIFAAAGVTDLFWSHCIRGETAFPEAPEMRLHPFPLYPVQQVPREADDAVRQRTWLFSFVGARASKIYLTQSRNMIIDILGSDPRGKVIDRDAWHYQRIVYDSQILTRAGSEVAALVNDDHSVAFREIMDESVFSLCPPGTGPNSIRLWEAMLNRSIPVILADTWAPPGPVELWEAATVRCSETPAAIAALPHRLAAIAADSARLAAMRAALAELVARYGPERFVDDVLALMEDETAGCGQPKSQDSGGVKRQPGS